MALASIRYFLAKAASLALIVAMLCSFSAWAEKANAADSQVQAQIDAAERAANRGPFDASDGSYEGSAEGFGGPVVVSVTLENGYIAALDLVSAEKEDKAWLDMAVELLQTIPEKQSTDVDVVSGATYSSAGIINATRNALSSALKEG